MTELGHGKEPAFPRWIARIWPAVALWSLHPLAADEPLPAEATAADGLDGGGSPRPTGSAPEAAIGESRSFADLVLPVTGGTLGERLASPLAGYGPVGGGTGLSFDGILLAVFTVLLFLVVFAPPPSAWPHWRH